MTEPVLCPQCGSEIPAGSPAGLCPKCLVLAGLESHPPADDLKLAATQASPQAGASGFVPPAIEELATKFPQLEILELLGRGGMGAVYKARQRELDRLVAVKILPPEVSADPAFAERFTREARALARLSHPNIVAVYDFGRTADGLFYFVMEYVDGVNLRQAIRSGGMSPKEALTIVPQICDALQFAHDEGIVHRDIKPENVLVDKKGRVKIADFGLAKLLGQAPGDVSLTATQQVMGTLRYMAPEQMEGTKSVDHRADIYSLGVVFYELLTGEVPFGRFIPPSKKVEIDVRLDEIVLRALEEKPEQRYQHASDVKTDVDAITGARSATMPAAASAQITVGDGKLIEWAQQRLRGPAIGLTVAAAIDCLCMLGWVVIAYQGFSEIGRLFPKQQADELVMSWLFFSAVLGIPILFGALKMRQLEGYRTSILASVLAALPITPGALVGLPIGIWALAVLTHPRVKGAFQLGTEVRAAFAAAPPLLAQAECQTPVPWRPRWVPQMVGGTAGIIASTALASLLVYGGLWLVNQYGPASYQVTDRTVAQLGAAAELEEVSPGKHVVRSYPYLIQPVAFGEGRTSGRFARLESLPRHRLTLPLTFRPVGFRPGDLRTGGGGGEMQIELETLGYRYVDAEGHEVNAEAGLSLQVFLDWMAAAGVDVSRPAAKQQASSLLNMAKECRTRKLMDLVSLAAFRETYTQGDVGGSVTLDPWVEPAVRWGSVGLWLAACALSVAVAVRRARRAAQEQGDEGSAGPGSTRWSGFCVSGFALALCAFVEGKLGWGGPLQGRIVLFLVIGLAAALASVGLYQVRTGWRGRGAALGIAALAFSLAACAVSFISTLYRHFDF